MVVVGVVELCQIKLNNELSYELNFALFQMFQGIVPRAIVVGGGFMAGDGIVHERSNDGQDVRLAGGRGGCSEESGKQP